MMRWSEQRAGRRSAGEAETRRERGEAAEKSEPGTSSKLVRLYTANGTICTSKPQTVQTTTRDLETLQRPMTASS